MIMINKQLYELMNKLHDDTNFKECTPLTDTQADMPDHMIHLNGNKFLGPRK